MAPKPEVMVEEEEDCKVISSERFGEPNQIDESVQDPLPN